MTDVTTPVINEWTHPGTGATRRYINNWAELAGLHCERYGTGRISGAWIEASPCDDIEGVISNRQAANLLAGKAWLDEHGELHLSSQYGCNDMTREQKRARIIHGLRAAGIEAH